VSSHQFTATNIRYFGVSGGQKKKFVRVLPSAHIDSNCSSHCFVLISDDLFAVRQQHCQRFSSGCFWPDR